MSEEFKLKFLSYSQTIVIILRNVKKKKRTKIMGQLSLNNFIGNMFHVHELSALFKCPVLG